MEASFFSQKVQLKLPVEEDQGMQATGTTRSHMQMEGGSHKDSVNPA